MIDNKLKKISDESIIQSLLVSAKEAKQEVFVWRLIGGSKHLANVRIELIRKSRQDFSVVPVEGHEIQVQELLSSQNFIDLYIPESALLLRCTIRQTEAPVRYYLNFPDFVAQVDRRKSFRINVHDTGEAKISFTKQNPSSKAPPQVFHKSCYDISSGGFSFFVSRLESKLFQIHDPIRNIELKVNGWTTKVTAEVALIKEVEPDLNNGLSYKVWRVCCRFSQIDQVSKKHLEKFIFERLKGELHAINE